MCCVCVCRGDNDGGAGRGGDITRARGAAAAAARGARTRPRLPRQRHVPVAAPLNVGTFSCCDLEPTHTGGDAGAGAGTLMRMSNKQRVGSSPPKRMISLLPI